MLISLAIVALILFALVAVAVIGWSEERQKEMLSPQRQKQRKTARKDAK
jgi:Flp pilus assembly protein TadB